MSILQQVVLGVAALVLAVLWRTGAGSFLLASMKDMADSYNSQYEINDDKEE